MPTELDPLVDSFQHDAHRPRAPEALKALQKIASLVKPIMRTRNWRVGVLTEFYPPETNLLGLNINRGEKICLRLRYPGDERQFLPLEHVVDTMLHELCHNVHGPHDEHFHALWNQLRDEHEALVRRGYTGEGFLSDGRRLGGTRLPMHEAKRRARAAAEKRRMLTAGSGQKLGGAPVMRGSDIRKIIADAAQRRIKVMNGCASGTDKGREIAHNVEKKKEGVKTTKAEEDDADERAIMQAYIDLIQEEEKEKYGDSYVPPSENNPAGMRATKSPLPSDERSSFESPPPCLLVKLESEPLTMKPATISPLAPAMKSRRSVRHERSPIAFDSPNGNKDDSETWTCEICTLVNPIQYLACDACTSERPSSFSAPLIPPRPTLHRPQSTTSIRGNDRDTPNPLKPRLNVAESLARLHAQEASKPAKPMGWTCLTCGNWMESQWWTCASCGLMKATS